MTSTATPSWRLPVVVGMLALLLSACGGNTHPRSDAAANPGSGASRPPPDSPPSEAAAAGAALLSWQPPSQHEDGTPLTDLAGYRIEYGMAPETLDSTVTLTNPGLTSYLVENLTPGEWFFAIRAVDGDGRMSARSGIASKVIG